MGRRIKNIYSESFYNQPGPKHLQSLILAIAKEKKVKKVLDVGCGSGWLVKALKETGFDAQGCDNSPLAVKKNIIRASATNLPFANNFFDMVTAISLIEHFNQKETPKFLSEVRRVLKPKGYFFLITPNFATPLRFLQGKNWHGYLEPTHITFYTPLSLKSKLKRSGFSDFKFTFKPLPVKDFDWIIPFFSKKPPRKISIALNYLAVATPLCLLKNSFAILAKSTKNE